MEPIVKTLKQFQYKGFNVIAKEYLHFGKKFNDDNWLSFEAVNIKNPYLYKRIKFDNCAINFNTYEENEKIFLSSLDDYISRNSDILKMSKEEYEKFIRI